MCDWWSSFSRASKKGNTQPQNIQTQGSSKTSTLQSLWVSHDSQRPLDPPLLFSFILIFPVQFLNILTYRREMALLNAWRRTEFLKAGGGWFYSNSSLPSLCHWLGQQVGGNPCDSGRQWGACGKIIDANPVLHLSVKFTQETAVGHQSINQSAIVNMKHIFRLLAVVRSLNWNQCLKIMLPFVCFVARFE